MSKRSGPRTTLGVIVSWKRCMQDHQVERVGSLYSKTASFSVSRRSTTKQGAHRLTTSTQLSWLMSCYSTDCWPKGAWVLARSKNSWNHAYKFSALFWFPFFVSRKEVFWDLYQTETLLKFVSANHFGPLIFPTCNFKFQVTLFLFHDLSQFGIVRGVVHSTPVFSFNSAQEIITGSWLKTDYVFSMQILLKMELQATTFSSVTVQRTLPGSLRIWFLFLRSTQYHTAFTSGTLSWEYPSSKTWRTACMAAAKCWLFCLTTTSPATSAGKSWTWPSRGAWIGEIRQWFLFWSTSLRKRDCLTLWGKRICWILRSTRRSKIGRKNCCKPYSEAKLLVFRRM